MTPYRSSYRRTLYRLSRARNEENKLCLSGRLRTRSWMEH
ncbi:hypothetical protein BURPS1106B_0825 [Burkholderia pseudomallei 1106b]|uniref:Uncharacterized protein n=1 Tax=Burkholderia pseudomallei (strain 1106a) TaxID=357348 RepID=A3P4E0_BURP0|nr:hypothetical protein BURPS1106A_A1165 [Burkholderia pseudomallei 1106a]EES22232.1 hypothetical protein BURPS1106B_0825 [Burkholderia pseudomallei 1106b]